MNWGTFGVINNHVESQRVVVMSAKNAVDAIWTEIFNTLVITSEPPTRYIKKVIVLTTSGNTLTMSPQDFSNLLDYEKSLPPGTGDIQSARMTLDYPKIRKDVDKWTSQVLVGFDTHGKPTLPKFPKPKPGVPRVVKPRKPRATKAEEDPDIAKINKPRSKPTSS